MRRSKAFTLIELLVVVAIIALLISLLLPSLARARELAKRAMCGTRLAGVGRAFAIYANQNRFSYPLATKARIRPSGSSEEPVENNDEPKVQMFDGNDTTGSTTSPTGGPHRWLSIEEWDESDPRGTSFASPTRDLFLLVRDHLVETGQFVCPSTGHEADNLRADQDGSAIPAGVGSSTYIIPPTMCWDFLLPENMDYGYIFAHDQDGVTANDSLEPEYPLLADANPYARGYLGGSMIIGVDNEKNSPNHAMEGQNVMFADMHASWHEEPTVGINGDNIYTWWWSIPETETLPNGLPGQAPRASPPLMGSEPAIPPGNWILDIAPDKAKTDVLLIP